MGVVNQKIQEVESEEDVLRRAVAAIELFGAERVLLTPDCGFATYSDNPVSSAQLAERKLLAITHAVSRLR